MFVCLQPNCDIDARDNSGCTLLYLATSEGNTYLIEQLVGYGADLNIADESGNTPLSALVYIEFSGMANAAITFHQLSNNTPELLKVLFIYSFNGQYTFKMGELGWCMYSFYVQEMGFASINYSLIWLQ